MFKYFCVICGFATLTCCGCIPLLGGKEKVRDDYGMSTIEQTRDTGKKEDFSFDSADYNNSLGLTAHSAKQYDKAVVYFQQAIRAKPGVAIYYSNLGRSLYRMEDYESAAKVLQRAVELDPKDPTVRANLADVYRQQEKYAEAAQVYLDALDLASRVPMVQARVNYELGNLYLRKGEYKSAEYRLNKAIELSNDFNQAILARAILYHMTRRDPEAFRDIKLLESRGYEVRLDLKESVMQGVEAQRNARRFRPGY